MMRGRKHQPLIALFLGITTLTGLFTMLQLYNVTFADNVGTSVTVSNEGPTFASAPYEDTASFSGSPVNAGSTLTFRGTGSDPNTDNYYLAICKTDAITPVDGAAPTCPGGTWCVSSSTGDGVEANCDYVVSNAEAAESNAWYAFVCDDTPASSTCSISSQGAGNSGSPFFINHRPTFTQITDDGGTGTDSGDNPGGTITFTATASDGDSDNAADTVSLVVCSTSNGATPAGCNSVGADLCSTSSGLVGSNPTCTFDIPAIAQDGNNTYYAHVFDNHGLEAASPRTGQYTVENVQSTNSNLSLNSGTDITLTENTTTNVPFEATVTDVNSCIDVNTVEVSLYRSGIGYTGCDTPGEANSNYCYPRVTCTIVGGTCSGSSDGSANYVCNVPVQYHADPTDNDTQYPGENWLATLRVQDDSGLVMTEEIAVGVELQSLTALSLGQATINYGAVARGDDTGSTAISTTINATGNVGIDTELGGSDMCTDYDTCAGGVIPVNNQEYSLAPFTFGSGTDLTLSASPVEVEINIMKTTVSVSPQSDLVYWGLSVPAAAPSGTYTGQNTITAVKGEVVEW